MLKKHTLLLFIMTFQIHAADLVAQKHFSRVVLWGHKLHSHSHSWIHWGFNETFDFKKGLVELYL